MVVELAVVTPQQTGAVTADGRDEELGHSGANVQKLLELNRKSQTGRGGR